MWQDKIEFISSQGKSIYKSMMKDSRVIKREKKKKKEIFLLIKKVLKLKNVF